MVADFAEYAGALFIPLLLIGAIVAIALTGLASTLRADSRFVRLGFIAVGALLAASSIWLVLYARGPDDYGGQTASRWDYAQSFMGTWPVVVAVTGGIATSLGLIATAYASSWARWRPMASLFAVIRACSSSSAGSRSRRGTEMTSRLSALGYLALMTLVVYGVMNREDQSSGGWLLVVLVVVQLAAGFLVGRWWAILLPLLVVVISVPAGHPPITTEEPFPIWFVLSFLSLFAIPLVGLGVVSRRTLRRI